MRIACQSEYERCIAGDKQQKSKYTYVERFDAPDNSPDYIEWKREMVEQAVRVAKFIKAGFVVADATHFVEHVLYKSGHGGMVDKIDKVIEVIRVLHASLDRSAIYFDYCDLLNMTDWEEDAALIRFSKISN